MIRATGGVLIAALCGLLPAAGGAAPLKNPYLSAGIQLFTNLDYEAALQQFARARSSGGLELDDEVALDLYEGLVLAELGRTDDARADFSRALALAPRTELPGRVSPKVRSVFQAAQQEMAKARRRAQAEAGEVQAHGPDAPVELTPPSPSRPELVSSPPAPAAQRSRTPVWVAAGVAVGLGVAGGAFGWRARSLQQSGQAGEFQVDSEPLVQAARKDGFVADGLWVGAGAAAVVALVMGLVGGE